MVYVFAFSNRGYVQLDAFDGCGMRIVFLLFSFLNEYKVLHVGKNVVDPLEPTLQYKISPVFY